MSGPSCVPPKKCECVLVDGSCPACLDKIRPIADLYLKATLEFFAKIEWIAAAHKPCAACMVRHADDWAADFITRTFVQLPDDLRKKLYDQLAVILLSKGVTTLAKTQAAYDGLSWPSTGKLTNLDELLKVLYGGK
jgi:hypothetical protein